MFEGPIDIVGDVHGEVDALKNLLDHLGYDFDGSHRDGRRLIFVGDLCDRGSDSPAVVGLVASMVERGLAQCVLGNHELNLLRQARKDGNGWYFDTNHDSEKHRFEDSRALAPGMRASVDAFFAGLPMVLERDDLRVVHAAWHQPSIDAVRASDASTVELYQSYQSRLERAATDSGLIEKIKIEFASYGDRLADKNADMPLLPYLAAWDELTQMGNPVRIITSGLERAARKPIFASGKWRMVDRVAWWHDYTDATPVIFGHYWRWPTPNARGLHSRGEPDLFMPSESHHLLGPRRNAFCVDFAVGARYKERARGLGETSDLRLGAVRWPEKELVLDRGERLTLQ